jgi:hypothetical protein
VWADDRDHLLVVGKRAVASASMAEGGGEACCVSEVLARRSGHGSCWRMVTVVLSGVVAAG